jgi:hypothetical protein
MYPLCYHGFLSTLKKKLIQDLKDGAIETSSCRCLKQHCFQWKEAEHCSERKN